MIQLWQLPLLFATAFAAGFVDSVAGGGGLITLPVLLNFGIDPQVALGTNKLQAVFGSGSASWHYAQAKVVSPRDCGRGFLITLFGAAAGAIVVLKLHPEFLKRFIPILLVVVAIYMLVKPQLGAKDIHPRMSRAVFDVTFGLLIGFYDGFLGPGTGTFWAMAFMLCLGFNMTKATGYTKIMNFASNISALIVFLALGKMIFSAGLTMGVGQLLGARLGSKTVVKHGTKFIRPVFITVALALTGKLIYDVYFKR